MKYIPGMIGLTLTALITTMIILLIVIVAQNCAELGGSYCTAIT